MRVIKKEDARVYLDGPEVCREYVITEKITFGSSILHPGQTGGIDSGHPEGHEIFYVSRGVVLMHNTATAEFYELHEGDAILVFEGEPHELTNIGTDMAIITWSCAPKID
ncbi:cupin domain-containing protein [Faecalicatena orotica]|uniref:cupin domain-containing protein n=1 Tax=Faecalicatena orotica TaxID=1544 RepID=UPI003216CD2C